LYRGKEARIRLVNDRLRVQGHSKRLLIAHRAKSAVEALFFNRDSQGKATQVGNHPPNHPSLVIQKELDGCSRIVQYRFATNYRSSHTACISVSGRSQKEVVREH